MRRQAYQEAWARLMVHLDALAYNYTKIHISSWAQSLAGFPHCVLLIQVGLESRISLMVENHNGSKQMASLPHPIPSRWFGWQLPSATANKASGKGSQ